MQMVESPPPPMLISGECQRILLLLSLAILLSPLCLGFAEEAHPRRHGEAQRGRVLLNLEFEDVKHLFVLHQVDGAQVGDKTPLGSLLLLLLLGQEGLQLLLNALQFVWVHLEYITTTIIMNTEVYCLATLS